MLACEVRVLLYVEHVAYIRRIACLDWFFLPNILLLCMVIYLEVADMMFYCETLNTMLIITA